MIQTRRLLLTTDVVGGVWDFSLALSRHLLAQRAAEVTLLALGEPSQAQFGEAQAAGIRLIAEPLKLEWMQDCWADVRRTRDLVGRLVRELRPDVLHANQFAAACAEVDVPVVLTLHSDVLSWRRWTLGASGIPREWRAYASLVREALYRADQVVAVSTFLAEEVRTLYSWPGQIQVIHNGWPVGVSGPGHDRPRSTLVAGRAWDSAKNISLVAEAATGWTPGPVYLAGEQANPETGCHVAVPAPLQALGFLSRVELDRTLKNTSIYLSPARYDPFGLLPLQAALHGCALLLSDIPSYRELWDGVATFFRSDDPVDLRRQWARLLEAPDVASGLAHVARQRAIGRYTMGHMAQTYEAVYETLHVARLAAVV